MLKRVKHHWSHWFVDHGIIRAMYNNFYPLSDKMYRISQPTPFQVRKYHKKLGIKTIINLRGENNFGSYFFEKEECHKLGIVFIDFRIYSRDVPTKEVLLHLKELFTTIEYPAMMHCKSGADRAGIASVLYLIFQHNTPVEIAIQQLGAKYGHFKQNKTGILDYFFQCYLDFNAHTPISFLDWVEHHFDRDEIKNNFQHKPLMGVLTDKLMRRE